MKRSAKFETIYRRGQAFARNNEPHKAIRLFGKILQKYPDDTNVLYSNGLCFMEIEKLNFAILCFDRILKLNSKAIAVLNKKSRCLLHLEKHDQALACINKALKINPRHTDSLGTKVTIFENSLQFDKAELEYDKFLDAWRIKYRQFLRNKKRKLSENV